MSSLADGQPARSSPPVGFIDFDTLPYHVTGRQRWAEIEGEADGDVALPTTLVGRVSVEMARRLIARGYVNTWLTATLLKRPEGTDDVENLYALKVRLATIIPQGEI